MTDDAAFLETIRAGELDALLVYADWLEEQGHLPRASFVRMQHQLLVATASAMLLPRKTVRRVKGHRAPKGNAKKREKAKTLAPVEAALVKSARELFAVGEALPSDWMIGMARPPLLETFWSGVDSGGTARKLRFSPDGQLTWSNGGNIYANGTWIQTGSVVRLSVNDNYFKLHAVIVGNDVMFGLALNIKAFEWTWRLTRDVESPTDEKAREKVVEAHERKKKRAATARKRRAETKKSAVAAVKKKSTATTTKKKPTATKKKPTATKKKTSKA